MAAVVLVDDAVVYRKRRDGMGQVPAWLCVLRRREGRKMVCDKFKATVRRVLEKGRSTWSVLIPALSLHLHVKACLPFLYIFLLQRE